MVPKDPLIKLPVTLMLHVTIIYALTQSQFEVFHQKMKFSIKDIFSKYDQICRNCEFGHIY